MNGVDQFHDYLPIRPERFNNNSCATTFIPVPSPNYYRPNNVPSIIEELPNRQWDAFSTNPSVFDLSVDNVDLIINISSEDDDMENVQPMNLSRKRLLRDASTVRFLLTLLNYIHTTLTNNFIFKGYKR